MRLDGLDLNLLVALDMLLQERSVIAASGRLRISQPSMSSALRRLRDHFGDDLVVQRGRALVPTPFALRLESPVREALRVVRANLRAHGKFVPSQSQRHYVIAASDAAISVMLGNFVTGIYSAAPGMSFQFVPVSSSTVSLFERGNVDFLIAPRSTVSGNHPAELLFSQGVSCIGCASNEMLSPVMTLSTFKKSGHVVVQFDPESTPSFEDCYFRQNGWRRRIDVVVYSFAQVPAFIVGTERIATLHTYLARHVAAVYPLRVVAPPMDVPRTDMMLQWHTALSADPAALWLKASLRAFAEGLGG